MSVKASAWAWDQKTGDMGSKLVLLKLADNADERGTCWRAHKTLATDCEMSRATVQRKLDKLAELGLLHVEAHYESGHRTANRYHLHVPQAEATPASPVMQRNRQGDLVGEGTTPSPTSAASKTTKPDPLWDDLVARFGEPTPRTQAHAKRNKAVADLRKFGATPETVAQAARRWPKVFEQATLTDIALATHYPLLMLGVLPLANTKPCADCGTGGGLHAADCPRAAVAL